MKQRGTIHIQSSLVLHAMLFCSVLIADPRAAATADFSIKMENNKYYIADNLSQPLTPAKYDRIDMIENGFFAGKSGNLYCIINHSGIEITPFRYRYIDRFDGEFFRAYKGNAVSYRWMNLIMNWQFLYYWSIFPKVRSGLIDKTGKELFPFVYDEIVRPGQNSLGGDKLNFGSGKRPGAIIVKKNGMFGCIDTKGNKLLPFIFNNMGIFNDGYIIASREGKVGVWNTDGRMIIKPEYYPAHCRSLPVEFFFNPEEQAAIFQSDHTSSDDLFYVYSDGKKMKYEDNWSGREIADACFPKGTGYIFVDRAALRSRPDMQGDVLLGLKTGAEVTILSRSDFFYSDGASYLHDTYEQDEQFFTNQLMKYTLKDRWMRVSVPGTGFEGYLFESDIATCGFFNDLDNNNEKELVLIKRHAYLNYETDGVNASLVRNRSMITLRVLRGESLLSQTRFSELKNNLISNGNHEVTDLTDIHFMKFPEARPRFFFLVLSWQSRGGFTFDGTMARTFYYFNKDGFAYVDKEIRQRIAGRIALSHKKIDYNDTLGNLFMEEADTVINRGNFKITDRGYSWDMKKMKFVVERDTVVRQTGNPVRSRQTD